VCERAGVEPARHHSNVALYGNTGAASAPSVLSQAWDQFGPEDDVALVGVGAGLTWGGALVRFEAAA
jgi:3-oxoacyl-[acyl-carrier-protein] synthase III